MKIWLMTLLLVLNISSIRGAKMPKNNIFGFHFDLLKREAHLVVGRKQAIFEVMGSEPGIGPEVGTTALSPGVSAGTELWPLYDGQTTGPELHGGPLMIQNRWTARPTGGRPLRYHFLNPMVFRASSESLSTGLSDNLTP